MKSHRSVALAVTFVALAGFAAPLAAATAPEIALAHLQQQRSALGLSEADMREVVVSDHYTSGHNGVTHVYLTQRYDGRDVYSAYANVNIARDGSVLSYGSDLVANLSGSVNRTSPVLSAAAAAGAGISALGLTLAAPLEVIETRQGAAQETILSTGGVALSPIKAHLVYQPVEGAVRLAWNIEIEEVSQQHWWSIRVDAENGALLSKDDFVDRDNFGVPRREPTRQQSNAGTKRTASADAIPNATDGSSYLVLPMPVESPSHGSRVLAENPAHATASPFGWHDTNGVAGPEFTITRGNNAHAYADTIGDGVPDPLSEPEGGSSLDFHFPFNSDKEPIDYRHAAVTNLFYWNNIIHDVFYGYGFTEAAGNFQVNNYGKGGAGNDYVQAEAQDGTPNGASAPVNNANFGTPVDGSRPRMQMYLWQPQYPNRVTVQAPSPIAGGYDATDAGFGPPLTPIGVTGSVVLVNDGQGLNTADGCEPLVGFPAGAIALIERGNCNFVVKVFNAQQAGAIAVIVHNNVPGGPAIRMGPSLTAPPTDAPTLQAMLQVAIPSVMVSYNDGQRFRSSPPFVANVARKLDQDRLRDGDFDNGVITHEYGHGISNRLTGGRLNVSCLNNQEQMGEGWSDFLAMVITARPGDTAAQKRGLGSYVYYQPNDGFGIRPTPYTTDMTVNPATYNTIKTAAVPHGVGYVWASMLWEVYWSLVNAYGFNPDIYGPWNSGGNNLAIQLVMDGMKLQKCSPGFVDGRDAILLADRVLTNGANQCRIWSAFAKRGLGFSAKQGSSGSVTDGTQAFDVPASCQAGIAVDPPSLAASQLANTTSSQALKIQNGTLGGDGTLNWTITETATVCSAPSDLSWLSISATSGSTAPGSHSSVTVTFDSAGLPTPATRSGRLCISSNDPVRPVVEIPVTLNTIYNFQGFFGTVKNPPVLNRAKSGSTVPVQFSLTGNHGLDIFEAGSPSSVEIDCETHSPIGDSEAALGSLSYDALTDRYSYKWRTQGDWSPGSCRALTLRFDDGTSKKALFKME
ncbi:MAG TPA: M36 family metallopeptidase [Thermoanaerobaculia bacterium]|nr:M36 family metallopeptidase [Thermoanaerobaculia bacterium]